MKLSFILVLLFISAPAFAQKKAEFKVGMTTRLFTDQSRTNWTGDAPRPLLTTVWYPASKDATEQEITIGAPDKPLFISGRAARNAKVLPSKKRYPLIVLSHGGGGAALQMMWLGEYLAKRGYIVAAANHHGATAAEDQYTAQGFILWWERSRDLTVTIDKMLADEEFGKLINRDKIGVAGFSVGGTTAISIAGGIFNPQAFENFCGSPQRDANCNLQPEAPMSLADFDKIKDKDAVIAASLKRARASYLDKRVKAVFAIAPAIGGGFTPEDLTPIKIPVEIFVGESDPQAPAKTNAELFHRSIKKSKLVVLPEVEHYTFLSECATAGKEMLPQFCRDAESVNRAAIHKKVSEMAFKFFWKNL